MTKSHLKRLSAPRTWPIGRKSTKFITKPLPGRFSKMNGIPARVLLTEVLGLADTSSEAAHIMRKGDILVDGEKIRSPRSSIGLMDVVEIPPQKTHYRMLINHQQKLFLQAIDGPETEYKLGRITQKCMAPGNKLMITTHDGRTMKANKSWNLGDTLVISVPGRIPSKALPLKEGSTAFLTGGSHIGEVCTVSRIEGSNVVFKLGKETFETPKKFAFVIGEDKPLIRIGK